MKRALLIIFSLLFIAELSFSQEDEDEFKTIYGNKHIRVSGFGGPMMSFGQIGDDFAHFMGGGGGIIVGNFFVGGYGMGKTNQIAYKGDPDEYVLSFGHGGFWFGYTFLHNQAIHPVIHTQVGWGSLTKNFRDQDYDFETNDADQVFVISPTIEIEFNFSYFFKVGAGGSYTCVYNIDPNSAYTFSDFAKPSLFLSFKFGWFK